MSHTVEQMTRKGQDYVCQGNSDDSITEEKFQWIMLNDGHGTDTCIKFIRSISQEKKNELISRTDPIEALTAHIDRTAFISKHESSGATCVIVKCYKDRVECISVGDSQFLVFKNGELIYVSKEHNCQNEAERQRLINMGYKFTQSQSIKLLSETTMTGIESGYAVFLDNTQLACTQALGHNSKTGYCPETYTFPLTQNDTYRVTLGSDGVFDMTMMENEQDIQYLATKTSQEICDKTVSRWLQEWVAHLPGKEPVKLKYTRDQGDDVSVGLVELTPIV